MDKRNENVTPIGNSGDNKKTGRAGISPAARKRLQDFNRIMAAVAAQASGYTLIVRISPSTCNL